MSLEWTPELRSACGGSADSTRGHRRLCCAPERDRLMSCGAYLLNFGQWLCFSWHVWCSENLRTRSHIIRMAKRQLRSRRQLWTARTTLTRRRMECTWLTASLIRTSKMKAPPRITERSAARLCVTALVCTSRPLRAFFLTPYSGCSAQRTSRVLPFALSDPSSAASSGRLHRSFATLVGHESAASRHALSADRLQL